VPGSTVNVELDAINRSTFPVAWDGYSLISGGGDVAGHIANSLAANQPKRVTAAWVVPADQAYSQPYWLRKPPAGDTYEIEDQRSIGMADTPPVLTAEFVLRFQDTAITLRRPVRYRYVGPTEGE